MGTGCEDRSLIFPMMTLPSGTLLSAADRVIGMRSEQWGTFALLSGVFHKKQLPKRACIHERLSGAFTQARSCCGHFSRFVSCLYLAMALHDVPLGSSRTLLFKAVPKKVLLLGTHSYWSEQEKSILHFNWCSVGMLLCKPERCLCVFLATHLDKVRLLSSDWLFVCTTNWALYIVYLPQSAS